MGRTKMRLSGMRDTTDDTLMRLQKAADAKAALNRPMGMGAAAPAEKLGDQPPFDLEAAAPRAIDLRKLWKLTNAPSPPTIDASLGPKIPVLVTHAFTAFHPAGQSPKGIWGMGYEARLTNTNGATESLVPDTGRVKYADIHQKVRVEFAVGGKMRVPDAATKALNLVPGVEIQGLSVGATTDQQFSLGIDLELSVLECQAGPVGAGGARWNLYRQKDPLDGCQRLLQTLTIPSGVASLEYEIKLWVRKAGLLGTSLGAREWIYEPVKMSVSLEGL